MLPAQSRAHFRGGAHAPDTVRYTTVSTLGSWGGLGIPQLIMAPGLVPETLDSRFILEAQVLVHCLGLRWHHVC